MKKVLISAVASLSLLASCNNNGDTAGASQVPVVKKEMNSEVVKTVANLSIDGMTCSSGCGGKIQQELQALKGVKGTELDFADGRAENIVSVEYSPAEISEQDMIKCVAAIADGHYHVKSVEVIQYKGLQGTGSIGSSTNDADLNANPLGKIFQLLNLLQSVSKIIE